MKTCSYCGAEYPDDAVMCAIDQTPLESNNPAPAPPPAEPQSSDEVQPVPSPQDETPAPEAEDPDMPEGFRSFGKRDPLEAASLLKQFEDAGIRFQINRVEERVFSSRGGYRSIGMIKIYVHLDDEEKAHQIISADWKV
jgi:hypothetical protein